jgi:hypothetical protein
MRCASSKLALAIEERHLFLQLALDLFDALLPAVLAM